MPEIFRANPKGNRLVMAAAQWTLRLMGWQAVGNYPVVIPKFVVIGAPHTSSWDFIYGMLLIRALGANVRWMAKKELFDSVLGWVFYRLGGLPIDRSSRRNVVEQVVQIFEQNDEMIIGLMPEGTRKRVDAWKTGFYYIALQANVPIVMAFFDYKHKRLGLSNSIIRPSGDIAADIALIRDFYESDQVHARHPEKFGQVAVNPRL
jgi:1-acyl-sn-glycerol-3-phosphate acyltransferase